MARPSIRGRDPEGAAVPVPAYAGSVMTGWVGTAISLALASALAVCEIRLWLGRNEPRRPDDWL